MALQYMTQEGLDKLKKELAEAIAQRPVISAQIAEARDKGIGGEVFWPTLGALRNILGKKLDMIPEGKFNFLWIKRIVQDCFRLF